MLQVLADRGAVGDICLHYYDKHGQPVLQDDEDPVIGMALDKIKMPECGGTGGRQRQSCRHQRRHAGWLY